jgi:hypothetical protein
MNWLFCMNDYDQTPAPKIEQRKKLQILSAIPKARFRSRPKQDRIAVAKEPNMTNTRTLTAGPIKPSPLEVLKVTSRIASASTASTNNVKDRYIPIVPASARQS